MSLAARAAPEIDRLVIAVHFAVRDHHRPAVVDAVEAAGLESPAIINDLAEFLLANGIDDALIARRVQYVPGTLVADRVEALAESGHLVRRDDRWLPDARLTTLLSELLAIRTDAARELWALHLDRVAVLSSLAGALIDRAAAPGPLFAAHRNLPVPEDAFLALHHRLTTLRYIRFEAHTTAWTTRGFDAATMQTFTALWSGQADIDDVPASLRDRGLATLDPPQLTAAGRELRDEIEAETNRLVDLSFAVLGDEAATLVDHLEALPGDAPQS
jgi:hypothetical protein